MAYETITTKKFLNATGVGHLWEKIRDRYDEKISSVVAGNDGISVANNNEVSVVISSEAGNRLQLKTTGNKGLYVAPTTDTYSYTIAKHSTPSSGASATYSLQRSTSGGTPEDIGAVIDIPKDMVVESGSVVTKPAPGPDDPWPYAGTFIELVLANATEDKLYIDVAGLIEYVTSGSQVGDMVVISIDAQHRVTASITDGTITKAKLAQAVQNSLDAADSAVQSISTGSTDGTIDVDGTEVAVAGLGSAAFTESTDYDAAGDAAAVLGTSSDSASTVTVYGVKQYASDVYTAIQALTNPEIDAAIAASDSAVENLGD